MMDSFVNITLERDGLKLPLFGVISADRPSDNLLDQVNAKKLVIFQLDALIQHAVVQQDVDGDVLAVDVPAYMIGVVISSESGKHLYDQHAKSIELFFKPRNVELIDVSSVQLTERFATLQARLLQVAMTTSSMLIGDLLATKQSQVELRQRYEAVARRLALLERATFHFSPALRVCHVNLPPSSKVLVVPRVEESVIAGTSVTQTLPIWSAGLAQIDIWPLVDSGLSGGELTISLTCGLSPEPVCTWTVDAFTLRDGWLALRLEEALTINEPDPVIRIAWTSTTAVPARLALGERLPLPEYCATTTSPEDAPLAMRIWKMLPGSRVIDAVDDGDHRKLAPVKSSYRFTISTDEMSNVVLLSPRDVSFTWQLVTYREDTLDILVHPVKDRATYAIIRGIPVQDARSLSALVIVDHDLAQSVEFGLALVPAVPDYDEYGDIITRWTAVHPKCLTEVIGEVNTPRGGSIDLVLATRMQNNADPNMAWAYFRRVEVSI